MAATNNIRKNWEIRNIWLSEDQWGNGNYCLKGMTEAEIRRYMRQIAIPGFARRVIAVEMVEYSYYAAVIEASDEYMEKDRTFKRRIRKSQLMSI